MIATDAIVPASLADLRALARDAAATRFFGAMTPEQALLLMLTGRDLGLSYAQSLRAFHIIDGRPTLSADGAVAVCVQHGQCLFFRAVTVTDDAATWETQRRGSEIQRATCTMADAQRAGLVRASSGWSRYPRRMLSARAKIWLARDVYPDLLLGLMEPEEARETAAREAAARASTAPRAVDVEVVRAEAAHADPAMSPAASFAEDIARASSVAELLAIGARIAGARLGAEDRAVVAAAWTARRAAIIAEGTCPA